MSRKEQGFGCILDLEMSGKLVQLNNEGVPYRVVTNECGF
jgi:hypothetical protein